MTAARRREVREEGPAKVVFLLQDLAFGGTQRQALELARRLDPEKFEVQIWTLKGSDDFTPLAEEWGLTVQKLGKRFINPVNLFRLWRRLKAEAPDLLVLFTVVPNIWGRVFGRLTKVPVIVANTRQSGNPKRQHEKLLKRFADHMICNAESLKSLVVDDFGWDPDKVSVIHNGVDLENFTPPEQERPEDRQVVVQPARLVEDKDHKTLLKAFARVLERHGRAELWIVGNGPRRDAIRKYIRKNMPEDRVKLMPAQLDMAALLHQADVLALSTHREGFPNVVAEAMASGLPVVATDVDGLAELVEDEATGLLIPPRNERFSRPVSTASCPTPRSGPRSARLAASAWRATSPSAV
ncbi:MAG: glycosyltransferase [Desulfovibrio sp.]|nr:MAG: glycosyltransferase [Desulfovibrio sp.]